MWTIALIMSSYIKFRMHSSRAHVSTFLNTWINSVYSVKRFCQQEAVKKKHFSHLWLVNDDILLTFAVRGFKSSASGTFSQSNFLHKQSALTATGTSARRIVSDHNL